MDKLTKPGAEDILAMNARQLRIDHWYALDGRLDPKHKLHGFYTGLADKYGADELAILGPDTGG